ncbi:hypothetical protein CEXT_113461 [Caerostris extrusa]|uniref:Uncharacterized protein n=1 Tax=Caerostris extrusa TaxID=172846 RepID=A0AAV4Q2M5_CAEEX|nr:hypothetical protein CEXT_113461 [Caerostris extrusa]
MSPELGIRMRRATRLIHMDDAFDIGIMAHHSAESVTGGHYLCFAMSSEERISSGKWGGNKELWTAGGRKPPTKKPSKTIPEEERKEKEGSHLDLRYLVYSCCKVVWKCSDEYRVEFNARRHSGKK